MKLLKEGEKSSAICDECKKLQTTTLCKRNVPFSDGYGEIKDLLVYVCDHCGKVVSSPQQSTPKIKEALQQRRETLGLGKPVESLYQNALELLEGKKQVEVEKITGVKQSQISRIKNGLQSRDTQAVLRIVEILGEQQVVGPFYQLY